MLSSTANVAQMVRLLEKLSLFSMPFGRENNNFITIFHDALSIRSHLTLITPAQKSLLLFFVLSINDLGPLAICHGILKRL